MPLGWGKEVGACSGFFGVSFFSFGAVCFLQTKILVLYAHMLNIVFKACEVNHLNRTESCNTGAGRRDSFVFTLPSIYCIIEYVILI